MHTNDQDRQNHLAGGPVSKSAGPLPRDRVLKSLAFEQEEIEELLDLKYGKAQTFSLLTLLFPFVNLQNHFHVDHVFPQARFRKNDLKKANIALDDIETYQERRDQIANLQLLEGAANIEKQDRLPAEWLVAAHPDEESRRNYREQHLLGQLPDGLDGFLGFCEARRARLRSKLERLLQKPAAPHAPDEAETA